MCLVVRKIRYWIKFKNQWHPKQNERSDVVTSVNWSCTSDACQPCFCCWNNNTHVLTVMMHRPAEQLKKTHSSVLVSKCLLVWWQDDEEHKQMIKQWPNLLTDPTISWASRALMQSFMSTLLLQGPGTDYTRLWWGSADHWALTPRQAGVTWHPLSLW